jgi:anti-sigma regulatory factor (Ser/Thr protein kinase)
MRDEITLALPAQEDFRQIAHLVLGGLGARLDLTYEDLDDLQTALDAILACRDDDETVELRIVLDEGAVQSSVGPFTDDQIRGLDEESSSLGLRRVLETVADDVDVVRRDGRSWVVLKKQTAAAAEATS